ncbi:MAG: corrinoid protein [Anaerolineae bacterium]|jgi:5-methyltetrahydrofolate--homocysteine methyltransferase|nr:corrinoid protein [Anaerolineae bacterium]
MEPTLQAIFDSIIEGDASSIAAQVTTALEANLPPAQILNEAMIAAMAEIGRGFEEGEYFVPEMLIAARAMKTGLAVLKPHLVAADVPALGKVVAGTIQGDLHDIGKNLVCMMLEGAGFEVVDLGTDVSPECFVEAARGDGVNLVAMSALLTTTMGNMKATLAALDAAGLRSKVKVMVGGAPVTERFAHQIGADGYAPDASRAVVVARALVEAPGV